jgi:putative transposase
MQMAEWGLQARFLLLDHDSKFTSSFDAALEAEGTEVKRVGPAASNLNATPERFVQTLKTECLGHFVICGEAHLRHLFCEFVDLHDNFERPHHGVGTVPFPDAAADQPHILQFPTGAVVGRERLGGLLRHYPAKRPEPAHHGCQPTVTTGSMSRAHPRPGRRGWAARRPPGIPTSAPGLPGPPH